MRRNGASRGLISESSAVLLLPSNFSSRASAAEEEVETDEKRALTDSYRRSYCPWIWNDGASRLAFPLDSLA